MYSSVKKKFAAFFVDIAQYRTDLTGGRWLPKAVNSKPSGTYGVPEGGYNVFCIPIRNVLLPCVTPDLRYLSR